ncbi:MAG: hypothetical protein QXU42_07915 [Thermoproteota archaeon]
MEIGIKESELDKISPEERGKILKFKKEYEKTKKHVSLFILEKL